MFVADGDDGIEAGGLVRRGLVDVVDDENLDGAFAGVEMKSELFLQSGEEWWQ